MVCFPHCSYFLAVLNFGVCFSWVEREILKMIHPANLASLEEVLVLFSKAEAENKTSVEQSSQSPSLWECFMQ